MESLMMVKFAEQLESLLYHQGLLCLEVELRGV